MRPHGKISFFIFILLQASYIKAQGSKTKSSKGSLPISIKDDGLEELKKGDVAMIFYITVANTGDSPIHLFVSSTRCCRKVTSEDMDCESMRLHGGDTGILYNDARDYRNLTLIYSNLYLHDRVGSCDIEIKSESGKVQTKEIRFDTSLIRDGSSRVSRFMEQYYKLDEVSPCTGVDENPLNNCEPYECEIRYDGARNYYDHKSGRCKVLPECLPDTKSGDPSGVAYIVETNACKTLIDVMEEKDFTEFHEGKPSVRGLTHAHSYPINVQCHNGKRDPRGRWCSCNPGWDSAPFNHKSFNPDVQVYHMCTVWLGQMSAEQARNITILPKDRHAVTNAVIFSMLGVSFFLLCALLAFILYRQRPSKDPAPALFYDESEMVGLTEEMNESETE